jgi:hypothetical protein
MPTNGWSTAAAATTYDRENTVDRHGICDLNRREIGQAIMGTASHSIMRLQVKAMAEGMKICGNGQKCRYFRSCGQSNKAVNDH